MAYLLKDNVGSVSGEGHVDGDPFRIPVDGIVCGNGGEVEQGKGSMQLKTSSCGRGHVHRCANGREQEPNARTRSWATASRVINPPPPPTVARKVLPSVIVNVTRPSGTRAQNSPSSPLTAVTAKGTQAMCGGGCEGDFRGCSRLQCLFL